MLTMIYKKLIKHSQILLKVKWKIDPAVVQFLTDEELAQYAPLHGDRIRLRRAIQKNKAESKSTDLKNHLINILKSKIETRKSRKSDTEEMRKTKRPYGNKNATKKTRRIEIGWIHKNKTSTQVRQKKGGGTRRVDIPKIYTKEDLLQIGKRLFFPGGESFKGPLSTMECDVSDFQDRSITEEVTIGEMYDETKKPLLRFYFSTTEKTDSEDKDENIDDLEEDPLPELSRPILKNTKDILSQAIELSGIREEPDESVSDLPDLTDTEPGIWEEPDESVSDLPDLQDTEPGILAQPESNTESLSELESDISTKKIKLRRGFVMKELISAFKKIDPTKHIITIEMIMPNGVPEAAEDGGGVTRDTLTEFWNSFYEECTGNQFKVPCLRPDFSHEEWVAVARIIIFGLTAVGHFPVQLSNVFFEQCLFGGVKGDLKEAFLKYIPDTDSKTLQDAISDITSVTKDELLEVLGQYEVRCKATQSNIETIIYEIAHKELIQSAMFIIDCWKPVLQCLSFSEEQLRSFYDALSPTTRRVLSILKFPDTMTNEESVVANHLRRFVRELDNTLLKRFLRFCTGSDLMVGENVEVAFVNVVGLSRRPVAHTCSCLLELPKFYENFPQFRKEFKAVLNASVWVMEII